MPYLDPAKQRLYQNEWKRRRRDEWLKANGPCAVCGSWDDLEADHINRNGKVDHKVWSWSALRRAKELKKCQVLCRRCHEAKTSRENTKPLKHGVRTSYAHKGCRCSKCTRANTEYQRDQRLRH